MKVRTIKVTARNQITIPYDIRGDIKWFKPGMPIDVVLQDKNTIVLRPGKIKKEEKKPEKKRRRSKTSILRKYTLKNEYESLLK